jgi:ankyrin repeat protein
MNETETISKQDFKYALDNDDVVIIERFHHLNLIGSHKILQYSIIENLENTFNFYLNLNLNLEEKDISNLIKLSIQQNNTFFLEKILDKFLLNGLNLNKPLDNNTSIVDYLYLNIAIYEKKLSHINILLSLGTRIDINYPINQMNSLHFAILIGHQSIVKVLIDSSNKSILNSVNKNFNTPLHLAILEESISMVKLLVENGANINFKNKEGLTPLDLVMKLKLKQNENENKNENDLINEPPNYDYEPESDLEVIEHYLKSNNAMSTFFSI